jgi:type IV pilus assembly protein PilY1
MTTINKFLRYSVKTTILAAVVTNALGAPTDISLTPLVTSSSSTQVVYPNVFMMMDDSGSMGWDFMPDDGNSPYFSNAYGFYSSQCNDIYYDPTITYTLPVHADGTSYPPSSFTAAPNDGFGVSHSGLATTVNLSTSFRSYNYYSTGTNYGGLAAAPAFYYTYSGTQTTPVQKNFYNTSNTFYKECNSSIGSTPGSSVFTKVVVGTFSTLTITGTTSSNVTGIKVNGQQIMKAAPGVPVTSASVLASNIAAQINLCTAAASGNCTVAGYSAYASGLSGVVTISAPPGSGVINLSPSIAQTGTMAISATPFAGSGIGNTDETTNFANWYTYYRIRINMMKSSTGLAFSGLSTSYNVGFGTMNNNNGNDFLNLGQFGLKTPVSSQRTNFYNMLYATKASNSTPLLSALSNAGLYYSHKLPSNQLNTVAAIDPVQYACQQNFTILSTDGFWNNQANSTITSNGAGSKCSPTAAINSTTAVGSCDSWPMATRPQMDDFVSTTKVATPTVTTVVATTVTPTTTTTPWTRTVTTVGAAASCTKTAATNPSGTATTAPMPDNSTYKVALGFSAFNPDTTTPADCVTLGSNAWLCRGKTSGSNPVVSLASGTDASGRLWYLESSSSPLGSTCTTDNTAWGTGYSTKKGACHGTAAVMGYQVTTQNQSATETATGTSSTVYSTSTTTTSTITTTNGVSGPAVITTTAGPTQTKVSGPVTATISDTGMPPPSAYANTGSVPTSGPTCSATGTPGTTVTAGPTKGTSSTANGIAYTASSPAPVTTITTQATTTSTTTSGGSSNTLSDVAQYYYITDLRDSSLGNNITTNPSTTGTDVSANIVPTVGLDTATWQHMTTFTLGLGARGSMVFSPTYQKDTSGDFFSVANGVTADSTQTPPVCSWQANGTTCNWPIPVSNGYTAVDDLWHAAVNGRGTYYSATNPTSLSAGINSALNAVTARTGSSASASISNPNISTGDNYIFSSSYESQLWYGHLVRQQLDLTTGALSGTIDWDAESMLDAMPWSSRNIYAFKASSPNGFTPFNSTNFGSNANFNPSLINSLSQFCSTGPACLTAAQQSAASGAALVNFLAGDRTYEGFPSNLSVYYRSRTHVLGDIVDSQASYVKAPLLLYTDQGYSNYVASNTNRQSMIYVGANDGMMHAFYATSDMMDSNGNVVSSGGTNVTGGTEAWAFIPTAAMPNLYKLADINYANNHLFYVDGSPVSADICPSAPATQCSGTGTTSSWKTILVGGLNAGGNSYYAIDITNPAAPHALWEFTNSNLGLSFGNPQIVKLGGSGVGALAAGTWVVLLTSGYNNADGIGHLFVLNAYTGALLMDIKTGAGSTASPSGLSQIIAQVTNPSFDATVLQVYGGDLLGNLWRFDINTGTYSGKVQLLTQLTGPTGTAQPVTSKPEIGLVNGQVVVYVGTGQYLGPSDIGTAPQDAPNLQSIYAIVDPLTYTTSPTTVAIYPNVRTYGLPVPVSPAVETEFPFVQQTEATTTCPTGAPSSICSPGQIIRVSSNNQVNIGTAAGDNSGWYLDFPDSGERINTNIVLELSMLAFNTNVPSSSACSVGGNSYNYILDYTSGAPLVNQAVTITTAQAATLPSSMSKSSGSGTATVMVAALQHTGSLSTAPIFISLPNGNKAICTNDSTGNLTCRAVNPPPPGGGARGVSWRQLISQ